MVSMFVMISATTSSVCSNKVQYLHTLILYTFGAVYVFLVKSKWKCHKAQMKKVAQLGAYGFLQVSSHICPTSSQKKWVIYRISEHIKLKTCLKQLFLHYMKFSPLFFGKNCKLQRFYESFYQLINMGDVFFSERETLLPLHLFQRLI